MRVAEPAAIPMVEPPSSVAIAAGLATGSVALLMLGLQPLLLGTLADEHRLSVDGIGSAATIELLTLGITTGLLSAFARPRHLRLINIVAALMLAAANLWGLRSHDAWLIASRGAAGVASGAMVWIAVCLVTRTGRPDRVAGVFLTVQTIAQAVLAAVLPLTWMVGHGANGGLAALALLAAASVVFSVWLPGVLPALPAPQTGAGRIPRIAWLGLASVFLWMAGIVGLWVFVEQLGAGPLIGARVAGFAVAAALVAQITGSGLATLLSGRINTLLVLGLAGIANVVVTQVLAGAIGPGLYLGSVILFGFLWMFAMPFQTRLLIQLDSSRRAAMQLSAVQLLGCAAGPAITSAFATNASLAGALMADAGLFVAGTGCVVVVWLFGGRLR